MKILMTGFTPLQLNSPLSGRRGSKINVPRTIVAVLREQGHDVDWRLVQVGEPIEDLYDLLLVNLGPAGSLNARMGALGALWAMSRSLPTVAHFDDWQFDCVFNNLSTLINNREKQMYKILEATGEYFHKGNAQDPELPYCQEAIFDTAEAIRRPWKHWLALCPMYGWGDKRIILRRMKQRVSPENFSFLDPTPLVIADYVSEESPPAKERAWAMASVMKHDYWVSRKTFTWPIRYFGTNKKDIREGKTTLLATEEDVKQEYAKRWGVLSPEYPQVGSGWFRSRFVYAAQTGSVLYCGARDGAALGEPYLKGIAEIERMSDADLAALAAQQRDTLLPLLWDKKRFVAELNRILDRAFDLAKDVR